MKVNANEFESIQRGNCISQLIIENESITNKQTEIQNTKCIHSAKNQQITLIPYNETISLFVEKICIKPV